MPNRNVTVVLLIGLVGQPSPEVVHDRTGLARTLMELAKQRDDLVVTGFNGANDGKGLFETPGAHPQTCATDAARTFISRTRRQLFDGLGGVSEASQSLEDRGFGIRDP